MRTSKKAKKNGGTGGQTVRTGKNGEKIIRRKALKDDWY